MKFVDDDGPDGPEEPLVVDSSRHKHGLKRFRGRQQDVGRISEHAPTLGLPNVAVPQPGRPSEPGAIGAHARVKVVQERTKWRHVEDGQCLTSRSSTISDSSGKIAASVLPPAVGATRTQSVPALTGSTEAASGVVGVQANLAS